MFGQQQQQQQPKANPNNDFELPQPPSDGVSCLKFSPPNVGNFIIAGSWDQKIRCWELNVTKPPQGSTNIAPVINGVIPKAMTSHDAQILCCDWSGDGQKVFTGGCDGKAKCWNLATNQMLQVGQHNEPIKELFWIEDKQVLVTGSWDKTIKYWDLRQPNPALNVDLSERIYAMDCNSPLLVAATADKKIVVYDLNNPSREYMKKDSPLPKFQARSLACFPDHTGYALGTIEGRVAIEYFDGPQENKFTFKCHRENDTTAYSVNCIQFAAPYGTFATAGSDGVNNFWDKDNRNRLKQFAKCPQTISAAAFNSDATLYAYSTSYDWSKGHQFYDPSATNYIFVHPVMVDEIKKNGSRPGKKR
ncbi:WD40 repeat-containing protein [Tieghemostelium lacteum]|uniref:WD40 repeat-containing protein n=1 Tax=Tieghemostelium lacteum TaxID=361077 RepID=A0A151ZDI6_TIELA|nr:WD40 repeat-containing protein [Tieghemostelium lacteum]|eukprot:KYQ91989.1 WD40 repeat-containing protein [Tieghemostelium lacteum]